MKLYPILPRRTPWLVLIALLLIPVPGCKKAPSTAQTDEIVVGEFGSLTGNTASFGQSSHKGVQMAFDEQNADGGVLGKKLRLVLEDDQSKAGEAATVVRRMISRENLVAILGEVASSRSLEAAPIAQQNKIPMISPSSTNPKVTEVGIIFFAFVSSILFKGP